MEALNRGWQHRHDELLSPLPGILSLPQAICQPIPVDNGGTPALFPPGRLSGKLLAGTSRVRAGHLARLAPSDPPSESLVDLDPVRTFASFAVSIVANLTGMGSGALMTMEVVVRG